MTTTKFALIAALAVMVLTSQAFAKTVRSSATADNPYYSPYENTNSGGSFPVGGFH